MTDAMIGSLAMTAPFLLFCVVLCIVTYINRSKK